MGLEVALEEVEEVVPGHAEVVLEAEVVGEPDLLIFSVVQPTSWGEG